MDNHPNIFAGPCPRCGSKNVTINRGQCRVSCNKCGFSMTDTHGLADIVSLWNKSKEARLTYIGRCLRDYGNAYVGDTTVQVWGDMNKMKKQIEKTTGFHVRVNDPEYIGEGKIVTVV